MPAIVLFNRRWRLASDDFVFPAFGELLLRVAWLIAIAIVLGINNSQLNCSHGVLLRIYYIGLLVLLSVSVILSLATVICSSRGTISNDQGRKGVPFLLYCRLALCIPDVVWTAIGTSWAFKEKSTMEGNHSTDFCPDNVVDMVKAAVIIGWIVIVALIVGVFVVFDPLGQYQSDPQREERSYRLWQRRCRWLCCCAGNSDQTSDAFEDVAQIISDFFKDIDVVPTDIVAGLILLRNEQRMRATRLDLESPMLSQAAGLSTVGSASCSPRPVWMTVSLASHYMKFAGACYGWPFFIFEHLLCGPCLLCMDCSCCGCIRQSSSNIHNDNCCLCNVSAILSATGIERRDILFASFANKVFETPFFIAVDNKQRSIIVAIRGSLSLSDALTDMSATPDSVPGLDHIPGAMAHRGILRAALYVFDKLNKEQLLVSAFEKYPDYRLVVTGHSLGAGTAAILALLLKTTYADLICFSYSPPGWLVSTSLSQYMRDFICSVVVDKDLVPRLGLDTMYKLKQQTIHAVDNCTLPKYRILLGGAWNSVCCLATPNTADNNSNSSPQQSQSRLLAASTESPRLYTEEVPVGGSLTAADNTVSGGRMSLYLPGHVMYLAEIEKAVACCGVPKYGLSWPAPESFDEIIVCSAMVADHLPDVVQKALDSLINQSDTVDLSVRCDNIV